MDSVIIDTNPLAYIYNAVPDLGRKYAILLGELHEKHILLIPKIVTVQPLSLPWPPARRAYASASGP
jgi:hypothetical protein